MLGAKPTNCSSSTQPRIRPRCQAAVTPTVVRHLNAWNDVESTSTTLLIRLLGRLTMSECRDPARVLMNSVPRQMERTKARRTPFLFAIVLYCNKSDFGNVLRSLDHKVDYGTLPGTVTIGNPAIDGD